MSEGTKCGIEFAGIRTVRNRRTDTGGMHGRSSVTYALFGITRTGSSLPVRKWVGLPKKSAGINNHPLVRIRGHVDFFVTEEVKDLYHPDAGRPADRQGELPVPRVRRNSRSHLRFGKEMAPRVHTFVLQ